MKIKKITWVKNEGFKIIERELNEVELRAFENFGKDGIYHLIQKF